MASDESILGRRGRNSFGFDTSVRALDKAESFHQGTGMRVLSMELVGGTRRELRPDPALDPVRLVFLALHTDSAPSSPPNTHLLFLNPPLPKPKLSPMRAMAQHLYILKDEVELITTLLDVIRKEDPDVLMGYDIQRESWGYLLERGKALDMELGPLISRVPHWEKGSGWRAEDRWWSMADISIAGRIMLNLWRLLRNEASLRSYTVENAVYHLLHVRLPVFTHHHLNRLLDHPLTCHMGVEYVGVRVRLSLELLSACDILNRTTEMAKVYGIQFFEVLSRGSQFRVESMLLRMTREQGYAAPSPSPQLRAKMSAPECIALTLEPESGMYREPVVVLDFQSLYPSIVIAHNYCYSTCLGKLSHFTKDPSHYKLGCLGHSLGEAELGGVGPEDVSFSPGGIAFVKAHVRRGVLPTMLQEILNTRLMVKAAAKRTQDSGSLELCSVAGSLMLKALLRLLDARQLALKLIANVTYGYTSANFSGRMPCVEVADSIVQKGREALETAIQLVSSSPEWRAHVVYGDTDSLFVHLPGRSKTEAFRIGREIAAAVTAINPKPMKLKFEKVYYPCILQTKKRYVGYAYESEDQKEPVLDAKGIETVRRDSIPLVNKVLEKTLRLLMEGGGEVGGVREFLMRTFGRVRSARLPLHEFVFAKEFRGLQGYKPSAVVPAIKIAKERMRADPRDGPLISERVEYVIGSGPPNATLFSCVRQPAHLLHSPRLNLHYYLRGVLLPPLKRVLSLVGADVEGWMDEAFRRYPPPHQPHVPTPAPSTLSQYYRPSHCLLCQRLSLRQAEVCRECVAECGEWGVWVGRRCGEVGRALGMAEAACAACARVPDPALLHCVNLHCPILHRRASLQATLAQLSQGRAALSL